MAFEDKRKRRFYVTTIKSVTPARQVTELEKYQGIYGRGSIDFVDFGGADGIRLGSHFPSKGSVVVYGQETPVDEHSQEDGMPIMESAFAYDPVAKKEILRGRNLSPEFQEFLKEKEFVLGFLQLNTFRAHAPFVFNASFKDHSHKYQVRGTTDQSPKDIGYRTIRAFFGFEPAVLVLPTRANYPYEVYHGRSGELITSTFDMKAGSFGKIAVTNS